MTDRLFVGRWSSHEQSLHIHCLRWPSDSVQLIQNRQQALNRDKIKRLPWLRGSTHKAEGDFRSLGVFFHPYPGFILPGSMLLDTVMHSLKCSSSHDSPAGVGIQDPCSKATPAGRARLISPEGVRMLRQESSPVTDTSPGCVVTSFL